MPFPIGALELEVEESIQIFFEVEDEDPGDVHFIWIFEIVDGEAVEAPSFVSAETNSFSLII